MDKVLLVKRKGKPYKNFWALPGGRKDRNESFEQCLTREVMEEVGLDIAVSEFFGCIRVRNQYGLQFSLFYLVVPTTIFPIEPVKGGEVDTPTYFQLDDLPNRIVPFHKTIIQDYLEDLAK